MGNLVRSRIYGWQSRIHISHSRSFARSSYNRQIHQSGRAVGFTRFRRSPRCHLRPGTHRSRSPRDRETILNLLTSYVRNRDSCTLRPDQKALPQQCTAKTIEELERLPLVPVAPDVIAAWQSAQSLQRKVGLGFELVDLARVRFPRADLRNALLSRVDLRGADLRGARLTKALIDDTNMEGADLRSSDLTSVGARVNDLQDVYFGDGGGRGVSFISANLRDADLRWARLNNCLFYGADLRDTNLEKAWLHGVDLRAANLTGVIGRTRAEIQAEATLDDDTKFGQ
ncbi:pentapeptide repeat-containing protein [Nonomuraea sp. NPDC003214]